MFDELRPGEVPAPPPNALGDAVRRGTGIRRRRRAAWAGGVAAVVLVGVAVLLDSPFDAEPTNVVPATATASPTTPPDYSPIPETPSETRDGVSFGYLQKVIADQKVLADEETAAETGAATVVTLRIQPGYFYIGEDAKKLNGGEVPMGDALHGEKEGTDPTDFVLDPKADLVGTYALRSTTPDVPTGVQITVTELEDNFKTAGTDSLGVWFRLADDGRTITALREQFIS